MGIILIHGIASDADSGGLFKLGKELASLGYDVKPYRYEKRHFWSYWFKGNMRRDGASLRAWEHYEPGDHVICHSNGHLVLQSAIEAGAQFERVFIFSGAGTSDKFQWPVDSVRQVHWFVNIHDMAVWFGSKLPGHPFGKAARVGYAGVFDHRHVNHKYDVDKFFSIDHSFWFNKTWLPKMIKKITNVLGKPE